MPYKFTEGRRHKFPRARYRVTNWPDYDAAMVRRGSLTVWFTEDTVAAWHASATRERGGQPIYLAIAIKGPTQDNRIVSSCARLSLPS
jgi:hypothetical protein